MSADYIARLNQLFIYDPIAGTLTRRVSTPRGVAGHVFALSTKHYCRVWVDGRQEQAHVICFAIHNGYWPTNLIDHKDRDRSNIKADNLREATPSQNQQNKPANNPNGKGVTWRNRAKNPWLAKIRVNGVRINLGSFPTAESAAAAYAEACQKYHGEFACLD